MHRGGGVGHRDLEPAGRQEAARRRLEGPDRRDGGRARPSGLAACARRAGTELGGAHARGPRLAHGALPAGHEDLAAQRHRDGPGQRFGEMAGHGAGVPRRVHHLDCGHRRARTGPGDGQATEHEDHAAHRGHRRVTHRHPQRGDLAELLAVGGGQHRGIRPRPVIPAHQVGRGADGDGRQVRACLRQGRRARRGLAGPAGKGEPLDRGDARRRPAPEHQGTAAGHRPGGVMHRRAERTDAAGRPGLGADRVDTARRCAARGQSAQDDKTPALARNHDLTADRGGQAPGEQAGLGRGQALRRGRGRPRGIWAGHRDPPVVLGGKCPDAREHGAHAEHRGHRERAGAAAADAPRRATPDGPLRARPAGLPPLGLPRFAPAGPLGPRSAPAGFPRLQRAPARPRPLGLPPGGAGPAWVLAGPVSHPLIMPCPGVTVRV